MTATTATGDEAMTCDGSPRSTTQILGRLANVLGRLAGQPPPRHDADETAPGLGDDDEE